MASKEFIKDGFKYCPMRDVYWNNQPAREWVRWENVKGSWVRSGHAFISRKATRAEIIDTLAGIYSADK